MTQKNIFLLYIRCDIVVTCNYASWQPVCCQRPSDMKFHNSFSVQGKKQGDFTQLATMAIFSRYPAALS